MNHIIKECIKVSPGVWNVELLSWKGCQCTAKTKKVIVHKETRPFLRDVVKVLG